MVGKERELYGMGTRPNNFLVIVLEAATMVGFTVGVGGLGGTVLDERMQKYVVSFDSCGGGNEGKEVVIDVLVNNLEAMDDKDGMAMLSMEVSTVGITWSDVVGPYGS